MGILTELRLKIMAALAGATVGLVATAAGALTLFFGSGSTPNAMIHVQGVADGSSTKYGPSVPAPAPVPLPAAGLMLLAGLGATGVFARRRSPA